MSAGPGLNLLFFGNSFTNNLNDGAAYDMPAALKAIAVAAGFATSSVHEQILLGMTLGDHLSKLAADGSANVIDSSLPAGQHWDDVILQEYSTRPTNATALEGKVALFRSDALQLFNEVRANSPAVKGVLYETWARGASNGDYPTYFSGPTDLQDQLLANYKLAAGDINGADGEGSAVVSPVGEAWRALRWKSELYSAIGSDGIQYHPSTEGVLLNAMVNFDSIYHAEASNIPAGNVSGLLSSLGVSGAEWTVLAAAADAAVAGSGTGADSSFIYGNVSRSGGTAGVAGAGLAGIHLWLDANSNGVYDAGEATAVTDASGNYFFSGLGAGVYHVREYAGGDEIVTPGSGEVDVTVGESAVVSGINFTDSLPTGFVYGNVSSVGGGLAGELLWVDANNDGVYEPGEAAAVTDGSGNYFFSGLTAGVYHVRQYVTGGATVTLPVGGEVDVTVGEGQVVSGVNFTDVGVSVGGSGGGTITGEVMNTAGSGLAGEHLWIDSNGDGIYEPGEMTATTDGSGNYLFSGLTAGQYSVREYVPAGTTIRSPRGGVVVVTVGVGRVVGGVNFRDRVG